MFQRTRRLLFYDRSVIGGGRGNLLPLKIYIQLEFFEVSLVSGVQYGGWWNKYIITLIFTSESDFIPFKS